VKRGSSFILLLVACLTLVSCVKVIAPPASVFCTSCYAGTPVVPGNYTLLENVGYSVGYSDTLENPLWASYRLFKVLDPISHERPSSFSIDYRTAARVSHDDYTNSGYDRGHMAPNASIDYCYGLTAQRESFMMSNICPQTPTLNRGIWASLEAYIRSCANALDEVWVFTGPVFDSVDEELASGVDIPDAFYKIVIDEVYGSPRVISFLIPQNVASGSQYEDYLVSVDEIESETGINFLWSLTDSFEITLEAQVPSTLWSVSGSSMPQASQSPQQSSDSSSSSCDKYVASKNSEVFHHAWCSYVSQISSSNKVCYCSREEAVADGKRPCKSCDP
jgi:DNA/RNA endonuclease G (NUC1)